MPVYGRTCRQEVLDAMVRLECRHGRMSFSPAEIVAEVASRGVGHAVSTVQTHIVSAMCKNAPANHAVRYEDLERVGPGPVPPDPIASTAAR